MSLSDPDRQRGVEAFIARLPAGRQDAADLVPATGDWDAQVLFGEWRVAIRGAR